MRKRASDLIANGAPDAVADALVSLWRAVREGHVATVTDNVERILGRKPISYDRWATKTQSVSLIS